MYLKLIFNPFKLLKSTDLGSYCMIRDCKTQYKYESLMLRKMNSHVVKIARNYVVSNSKRFFNLNRESKSEPVAFVQTYTPLIFKYQDRLQFFYCVLRQPQPSFGTAVQSVTYLDNNSQHHERLSQLHTKNVGYCTS